MDKEASLKLATSLKFWYQYKPTKENFNESLVPIATFDTVEDFWALYQHFNRPSTLEDNTYLYLFQESIKPVWEDDANLNGGSFVLRFDKGKSDKVWEDMLLAFLKLKTEKNEAINGIRSKIRKAMLVIEVWVRNGDNEKELQKLRDWILEATFLNNDTPIQFIHFHKE